jgi:hypothetical protein
METTDEVKRQISRLYHDNVYVEEAFTLMEDQNVSAKLVKSIYDQLSKTDEKLIKERFYYYTINPEDVSVYHSIYCWTSRYLLINEAASDESAFHEIKIFDAFNDKSM